MYWGLREFYIGKREHYQLFLPHKMKIIRIFECHNMGDIVTAFPQRIGNKHVPDSQYIGLSGDISPKNCTIFGGTFHGSTLKL